MQLSFPVLVADIGGTNARFAMIDDAHSEPRRFDPARIESFDSAERTIEECVFDKTSARPASILMAIASPLLGDRFRLTNADWTIEPQELVRGFGLRELVLVNDFTAQGLAALALGEDDLVPVGKGKIEEGYPKVILGPGTGLGVATVVRAAGKWSVIPGEGGHVDLGPRSGAEFALWPLLGKAEGRMSAEMALSGRGLENLYLGLCRRDDAIPDFGTAAEISKAALAGNDTRAGEAVMLFLDLLARFAGDMALITLSRGGVYIAGGIAEKLLPAIDTARFRREFENKAPHRAIMREIPIRIISHPLAGLEGLAACARRPDMFALEHATRVYRPASDIS